MMKRNLFTLAVAMFISCAVYATEINRQQAAQLARDYMSKNFSEKSAARRTARTIPLHEVETGQSLVYAFNIEGGGFVVVAGDDCAPAILGFSEKSVIDPQDIPDGMKYLFEQYQQDMQFMIQNGLQASETATLGEEVKPLMASKWGQGAPYNYMSPKYKKNKTLTSSLAGCVAVAMAQIMYYHKYPAEINEIPGAYYNKGKGKMVPQPSFSSKTLEWDKMLPTYGTRYDVGGTQEQQDAVAKLLRLVGQSVCMTYTPSSSGSNESAAYSSFVNFFNYDAQSIKHIQRSDYSYDEWVKIIYNEVAKERRPVYYGGKSSSAGHAFVVEGYKNEDFFYINWGWYGNQDNAFRLQLCDAKKKYEGGGSGSQGYACRQEAIIGIKPATSPQHADPVLKGFFKWTNKDSHQRASVNDPFDLTNTILQNAQSYVYVSQPFGYGVVVKKEDGTKVQELLPLSDETKSFSLEPGRSIYFNTQPLKLGAGLGDGTYFLEFQYRVGEGGEWHSFYPNINVMFKITGNTLTFSSCPDWLEAKMIATKVEDTEEDCYVINVNLKNNSTDKTFHRSLILSLDNNGRTTQNPRIAASVEPGEEKVYNILYEADFYTPKSLYLSTMEEGTPLCKAEIDIPTTSGSPSVEGSFNLTTDLKQLPDKSYVLKADDTYEVVYQFKNAGTAYFAGYLGLIDTVRDIDDMDFEDYLRHGDLIRLQPGETGELRLTISNEDNPRQIHRIDVVSYNNDGQLFAVDNSEEFSVRPVYDLQFSNFSVTPSKAVEDAYADYIINGNQATVSGKISNPEDKAFNGLVMIKRYTIDMSEEVEQDEDGDYYIDCDKIYATDVTIPANGSVDYSQVFDMEGLVTDPDYSVMVDFEITFIPDYLGEEIPLYFSDLYLVNDGTPTGINVVRQDRQLTRDIYDLQGRRVSGKTGKGLYIINGKKVILR